MRLAKGPRMNRGYQGTTAAASARRWIAAAACLSTLAPACSISPMPEPPAEQPKVDLGGLTTKLPTDHNDVIGIQGGPGAASPAGAVVRAFNLDTTDPPSESVVQPNGSFLVVLTMSVGQEGRIQVLAGTERSTPLDFVAVGTDLPPVAAERPLTECLLLAPALELDAATVGAVEVTSQCGAPVTIVAPYLRRTVAGFQVGAGGSWPAVLDTGEAVSVPVDFQANPGTLEEIFFIEATLPQNDRRPVTVFPATG
jgi:hypothetical protein